MKTGPLTGRDKRVATFENLLSLSKRSPRSRTPASSQGEPQDASRPVAEADLPLNNLQKDILEVHYFPSGLTHSEKPATVLTQGALAQSLAEHYTAHKARTLHWKEWRKESNELKGGATDDDGNGGV